jgi:hypothetical protein
MFEQQRRHDEELRSRFEKIEIGMSRAEVREIMGDKPEVIREDLWGFKLSWASDTGPEINWVLLVAFEDGEVSGKETSYTCIHLEYSP